MNASKPAPKQPTVTVPFVLPLRAWGRLATIAEHRRMTVAELLAEAAEDLLGVPRRVRKKQATVNREDVARLHATGLSNQAIARELGASDGAITHHINALGLKANGRPRVGRAS